MYFSKSIKHFLLAFLMVSAAILSLTGCKTQDPTEPLTRSNIKLGTLVSISLYDTTDSALMDLLFNRLDDIEQHMSLNVASSEINAINQGAGHESVAVSADTFHVIESALSYAALSNGKFDITVGPIVELWGIGSDHARVPEQSEIDALLPLIDYDAVALSQADQSVYLPVEGMKLDLGAIAKGYAADELVRLLDENNIQRAIINLGGNVYVKGEKASQQNWRVGVQNPFDARGAYLGIASVADETIVTSGIYERYLEVDGIRYHHILNPVSGMPVNNELASVTIITAQSMDADAYSTILFTAGLEEGLTLANANDAIKAIFVTRDQEVYLSEGTASIFELTDSHFEVMN